MIYISCKW